MADKKFMPPGLEARMIVLKSIKRVHPSPVYRAVDWKWLLIYMLHEFPP
jgi:hypothetical protein